METGGLAVSVVVPTFERRPSLERLLDALGQQDLASPFEVIVVDDGSGDGTAGWLRTRRAGAYALRVLEQEHAGPAAARNLGVAQARAELIVFLDDDVVPAPDLLLEHVRAHRTHPNSVVCGPMLPPAGWRRPAWIRWEEEKLLRQYRAMSTGMYEPTYRQFFTGNASLLKDAFSAAGGFDVSLTRAEDLDLGHRLDRSGLNFVFDSSARVWHYPQRSFRAWRLTPYRYGQADVFMNREKGNPVLGVVMREFHERNWLARLVVRACVGRRLRFQGATHVLSFVARSSGAIGLTRVALPALSALYSLAYWQGVSDALGGPRATWNALGARAGAARETAP